MPAARGGWEREQSPLWGKTDSMWAGRAGEAPRPPSLSVLGKDSEEFNRIVERACLAPEQPE